MRVYHIEDSTSAVRTGGRSCWIPNVDRSTTVRQFKRYMESITGVPPERQRYHGYSHSLYIDGSLRFRFDTPEILDDDDQLVRRTGRDLFRVDRIKNSKIIGLVVLPATQTDSEGDGDEDEPRVIREVDAVEDRIAAGRANAIEIGTDSDSNNGDDHRGPPPKRQRRSRRNERTHEADTNDAEGDQLRRWLRSLDADSNAAGRFERYAPALERQFDSLAELALVPETEGAWTRTVQACGICKVGDEVMLMRAIRRLPRPA
uniref:Uncharacterized protein n=1 Tax=Odontella aurita TaxID=265563 RepID=A0A7S4IUB2_9STRA|mmetsp:Transcript_30339/g.90391  ORF Transcript_30339/g.90391 Transcript_30339/m.90391 type:complete len:260 (+) Transcript_30339:104-883(+)